MLGNSMYKIKGVEKYNVITLGDFINSENRISLHVEPSRCEYRSFHKEFPGTIINIRFDISKIKEYELTEAVSTDDVF